MPRLTIPPDQKAGLQKLDALSAEEFEQLKTALAAVPMRLYVFQLTREASDRVPTLHPASVEGIVEALWQIEFMRYALEAPKEPFMEDIAEAIAVAGVTADLPALMERLDTLLGLPSLTIATKARVLLTDANSYCRSRVLTDIRPVFGPEVEAMPQAGVVVHHLTIGYHTTGPNMSDVVVSLDADDINNLIETLQRAQKKQYQLQQVLAAAKVPYLDVD
jgi:hypothetical protein